MPSIINKTSHDSAENKYIGLFLLHALGDVLGTKNLYNEDNIGDTSLGRIPEFIFDFIEMGGVNGIDITDLMVSDNTLFHISIAKSVLKFKGKFSENFFIFVKRNIAEMHNKMVREYKKGIFRYPNPKTAEYIQKFTKEKDARFFKYDPTTWENGSTARSMCIGLAFNKPEQLETLIEMSIKTCKLTHNSPYGFLSGFNVAYFVSLAIQQIPINKWPNLLVDLLESDKIKKYINYETNGEIVDYVSYIRYWRKYIDTRFIDEKPIKTRVTGNLVFRAKYYFENFVAGTEAEASGASGFSAVIMAYDSILDCDGKWEKIIFYAILHPGECDTTGAIAGGFYGALYGFGDVPENMICCIEEKKQLLKLGEEFYKKFA